MLVKKGIRIIEIIVYLNMSPPSSQIEQTQSKGLSSLPQAVIENAIQKLCFKIYSGNQNDMRKGTKSVKINCSPNNKL